MRITEAIERFLRGREADSPFLIPKWSPSLETQVMTSTDGEEVDGEYTANGETWSNKRWPYQAGTDPNYSDPQITFSPANRVTKVGTTWWSWKDQKSVAIGIDIDYQDGHAETTTTNNDDDIAQIVRKLEKLDYITIVRSTGGKGIHVYVFFHNQPQAKNHHEHTIVARKTLELISHDIGYDLKSHVDCVGSLFWIWSTTSMSDHPGFTLIKEGSTLDGSRLATIELPTPAVRGKGNVDFEVVEFEEEHKRILEVIARQGYYFNVRADMNLVHTHTCAIRDAFNELADTDNPIRGSFVTASEGSDPNTANCFLAPVAGGTFRVYRFGQSQHEPQWEFRNGKNYCFLNESISYQELVSNLSDKKTSNRYQMSPQAVRELAERLGEPISGAIPDDVEAIVKQGVVELYSKKGEDGWEKAGKVHKKSLQVRDEGQRTSLERRVLRRADEQVRFVTQDGNPRGWYCRTSEGWQLFRNFSDISCVVDQMFGEFAGRARSVMLTNPWKMVQIPFEEEYPGNRQWNYNAPQLAYTAADSGGEHPHFDMILDHIGASLDQPVQSNDWCRRANINNGADYLRAWLACLIHHTQQPLPYLFLVGPQNSGKSIFHESAKMLFTHGVASANAAITQGHNGELMGCFLVYVEERDLADKRHNAYERIKEWVTGRELQIHEKYMTPFMTPNYLHFVQMANKQSHLPLEDGDTRIVAVDVPSLKNPVPKAIMEEHLKEEAPRFTRTLLNTVVPPPVDRLRIPALTTKTKRDMEIESMTSVMLFAREHLFNRPGHLVSFDEFYASYRAFVQSVQKEPEPKHRVMQELMLRSDRFTIGTKRKQDYLVNCSLDEEAEPKEPISVSARGKIS